MNVHTLLKEAVKAHKQRNLAEAEQLYKRVLAIEPNNVDATHYLALIAQEVDRHDIAVQLLEKALSFAKNDANIRYNLALSLQKLERFEDARHHYYEAIKLNPSLSVAYNNLGVIYQQEGLHDKASALFQKAISLDSGFADAYFNLAQSKRFSGSPEIATEIENLLKQNDLKQNEAIACHFALGKIYDDLQLYTQAFEHYREGNDLKNQGFNIEAYRKYVYTIESVFDAELLARSNRNHTAIGELIFVLGMPRSGTTLVEQIIGAHPKVTTGGEMGIIGNFIDEIDQIVDAAEPYPQCIAELSNEKIRELSDRVLIELERRRPGFLVLTDKTPVNFLHVGLIHLLFPKSRIIHCTRNPLDTCLSCYFQNFNRRHHYSSDLKTLGQFYRLHEHLLEHWKNLLPDRILSVNYEQLVSHGEEEIRRIIDHCGLDWSEQCLHFDKNANSVRTASNWQVRQPLYKRSVNRWENYREFLGELFEGLDLDQKLLL
ncbi:MAG: sulfotransferase [Gammaproteobacteria bacterium]|nr:sulfotransferase [Gammaproteobacteria bacterium]